MHFQRKSLFCDQINVIDTTQSVLSCLCEGFNPSFMCLLTLHVTIEVLSSVIVGYLALLVKSTPDKPF